MTLYHSAHIKHYIMSCYSYLKAVRLKYIAGTILWLLLWVLSVHKLQMGNLYLIISIAIVIFTNFDERKANSMSAYSVFNRGYQRLLGTLTAEQFERERVGNYNHHDDDENYIDVDMIDDIDVGAARMHEERNRKRNKTHHKGKKSRRNYEERKRRKDQYNQMVAEQLNQDNDFFID